MGDEYNAAGHDGNPAVWNIGTSSWEIRQDWPNYFPTVNELTHFFREKPAVLDLIFSTRTKRPVNTIFNNNNNNNNNNNRSVQQEEQQHPVTTYTPVPESASHHSNRSVLPLSESSYTDNNRAKRMKAYADYSLAQDFLFDSSSNATVQQAPHNNSISSSQQQLQVNIPAKNNSSNTFTSVFSAGTVPPQSLIGVMTTVIKGTQVSSSSSGESEVRIDELMHGPFNDKTVRWKVQVKTKSCEVGEYVRPIGWSENKHLVKCLRDGVDGIISLSPMVFKIPDEITPDEDKMVVG